MHRNIRNVRCIPILAKIHALRFLVILNRAEAEGAEFEEHGAPRESCAESGEAGIEGLCVELLTEVEGDICGDSGTAGVTEVFDDVIWHAAGVYFHFCREFLEHEAVGLVEEVVVDGWFGAVGVEEELLNHVWNGALDEVEDGGAVHDELICAAVVLVFSGEFDGGEVG